MKEGLLIYGCYGYTGKLISEHAVELGMKPVLAGRDEAKTKELAASLNLSYIVFGLDTVQEVAEQLKKFKVVLHCAGPFAHTASVMAKACIQAKTHYLDITGEFTVFEKMFKLSEEAKKAGVMLMPGVGFDVVPTDCMALYLKEKLNGAESLEMALYQKGGKLSHGTAITVAENLGAGCVIRKDSKLVKIAAGSLKRVIDFGDTKRNGVAIPWGDVSTAFRTTKIPNITIYNVVPQSVIEGMKLSNYIGFILNTGIVKRFLTNRIKKRPAGPDKQQREKAHSIVWGEVKNALGICKSAVLELPEGYTLTAWTAVKIAQEVLATEPPHGTFTPAAVYGKDFILQFDKVKRRDLN
ncbi:MAG: saccharopine dehydrogenase NADP-binding domain-containing protein [Bacteroidetes bacterium]|nr:saccharopine dehydrogenase NADP-binding domain-containing protein [Bacteroidota bacterium]